MLSKQRIKRQINNVRQIADIIYSTELISASRLRRSQIRLKSILPYSESIEALFRDFISNIDRERIQDFTLLRSFNSNRELLLAIGGERGLCGGYITSIVKKCEEYTNSNIDIIAYGSRTGKILHRRGLNVIEINPLSPIISFESVQSIFKTIQDRYISGRYNRVRAVYLSPKTAFTSILTETTLIPVEMSVSRGVRNIENYIIEPSPEEIVKELLPIAFTTRLYRIFLEAITSEYSARRIAMHQAYENAKKLLKRLNIIYQKLRQGLITTEITEICASKMVLEGEGYGQ